MLLDQQATRRNIIRALYNLSEEIDEEDRILIYYSGHGYMHKRNKLGYWIPIDAEKGFKADYIANAEIQGLIKSMTCRHMLLISDSCFSGSLLVRDTIEEEDAFDYWEENPSRWIFCSGKGVVADGPKNENSPFAKQLMRHLSQAPLDKVNINWLAEKVIRSVRFGYEQQAEACPLYGAGHDGGQFIFYKNNTTKEAEKTAFELAKQSKDIQVLINFLEQSENKNDKRVIRKVLRALEQQAVVWEQVDKKSYASLDEFIDEYPDSPYLAEAERLKEASKSKKIPKVKQPEVKEDVKPPVVPKPKKTPLDLSGIKKIVEKNDLVKAFEALTVFLEKNKQHAASKETFKKLKEDYSSFLNNSRIGAYKYSAETRERKRILKATIALLDELQKPSSKAKKPLKPKVKIVANTFVDPRDGQHYKVVELQDGNIWLAQNLNFHVEEGCWFYEEKEKYKLTYGRLYNWEAAMKACPPGWRIPSKADWWKLRKVYGGSVPAYSHLIDGGDTDFKALLGGYRDSYGGFIKRKTYGCFWSSTKANKGNRVLGFDFRYHRNGSSIAQIERFRSVGRSVRCILDR